MVVPPTQRLLNFYEQNAQSFLPRPEKCFCAPSHRRKDKTHLKKEPSADKRSMGLNDDDLKRGAKRTYNLLKAGKTHENYRILRNIRIVSTVDM